MLFITDEFPTKVLEIWYFSLFPPLPPGLMSPQNKEFVEKNLEVTKDIKENLEKYTMLLNKSCFLENIINLVCVFC